MGATTSICHTALRGYSSQKKISEIFFVIVQHFRNIVWKFKVIWSKTADQKNVSATKEGRILRRQSQNDALNIASAAGTLLYGPGIDDSM